MGPGEIAAMSWVAEMATLSQAASLHNRRYIWFDFDAYLAKPDQQLAQACSHLQLNWTDQDSAAVEASGLRGKYSKDSSVAFDSENRKSLITNVLSHHASEISKARDWAERAIATHPELSDLAKLI